MAEVFMRQFILSALVVSLSLTWPHRAAADDDARALVEKAVKALGGEEVLGRETASHVKMRGSLNVAADQSFPFTGEVFMQPNGDFKYSLDLNFNGMAFPLVMVLTGDKGWRSFQGMVDDLDADSLADMKRSRHYDRVTSLIPLLKDKNYTLAALGEVKIKDKPALGVKVSFKGQPDIKLFFDKDSGLPAKSEYRYKPMHVGKEVLQETYYSDYREPDFGAEDEKLLKAAKLKTDGPALLEFLRKKVPAGSDMAKIKALIEQLGDDSFDVREKATAELIALGASALPLLRQAAESTETEVRRRANQCIQAIGVQKDDKTVAAAIRLVALRKPAGAAEVLLTWEIRLADDALAREVRSALAAVAVVNGKPDDVLVKALDDKDPQRRAAAAAALGKDGGSAEKKPGRRVYLTGMKYAMKAVTHQDGAKQMEREILDIQLFNRFDDSLFVKPK
jgi:hypothetical protein